MRSLKNVISHAPFVEFNFTVQRTYNAFYKFFKLNIRFFIYSYKDVPSLIARTRETRAKIRATKIWVSLIIRNVLLKFY